MELKSENFNEQRQLEKAKLKLEIISKYFEIWELQNKLEDFTSFKDYLIKIEYLKTEKFSQIDINLYKTKKETNILESNKIFNENLKIEKFEDALELIHSIEKLFKYKFMNKKQSDLTFLNENSYNLKTNNREGNYNFAFDFHIEDKDLIYKQFDLDTYKNIKNK